MFLNAVMLAGISAAVLPFVLHLLSRARYRRIQWGAMMFLEDAESSQLNSSRLRQWLLLLLRTALIVLLAIAFARPTASSGLEALAESQRLAAILVVDVSPSMAYPEATGTRIEEARRACLGILTNLRKGDEVGMVRMGATGTNAITPLTSDLQETATQINAISLASREANILVGVRSALQLLDHARESATEIYIVSDRQAITWESAEQLGKIVPAGVHVHVVPVGTLASENVSVEAIEIATLPIIKNVPVDISVRVHNWGRQPYNDLPLTLRSGNQVIAKSTSFLSAGGIETVRMKVILDKSGPTILTAHVEGRGLSMDDQYVQAVDVLNPLRVLIVCGDTVEQLKKTNQHELGGDADYLKLALTPYASTKSKGNDPAVVTIQSVEQLSEINLKDHDILVLANVADIDERLVRQLEQFVFAGGGLLVAPGSRLDPQAWNTRLYRDGMGLLPASVKGVRSADAQMDRVVGMNLSSPVFKFAEGRSDPVPLITVMRHVQYVNLPESTTILASLQTGDAFLIERAFGRGHVLALAVPVDDSWSNLSWSNLYLPLMQSAVRYLGASSLPMRNIQAGSTIELPIDVPHDRAAQVRRPDGRRVEIALAEAGDRSLFIYPEANQQGVYDVNIKGLPTQYFVVQNSTRESDLTPIADDAFTKLTSDAHIKIIENDRIAIQKTVGATRQSVELSLPLILICITILIAELFLSQRWGVPNLAKDDSGEGR